MPNRKRHLLVTRVRAACGLKDPPFGTYNPSDVTCMGCRRSLAMADAEVKKQLPK